MKKYISLSRYPGKVGEYFYNNFFNYYGIDAVYEPRGTDHLYKSLEQAVMDNVAGISISMPYKKTVLEYLDKKTAYCQIYNSCNTITVENGLFVGHNADYFGMEHVCRSIPDSADITILGNGAMADMFTLYLEERYYTSLKMCARTLGTWEGRHSPANVIINCTGLGTSTNESPYDNRLPESVELVIDLAIRSNRLENQCKDAGIKYISGKEFYKHQFLKQFEIYTGIAPNFDLFNTIENKLYETI